MNGPEGNKWLDEALSETIGSKKLRTDFEQWKQQHPQAVQMLTSRTGMTASVSTTPPTTWRIIMTSKITKLAAAAVIAIAAIAGISKLNGPDKIDTTEIDNEMATPQTFKLADGSQVTLAKGAKIRINNAAGIRGFEHVAGRIDVSVVKGKGEFIVTSPYGNVKALGTRFTLDMVDGVTTDTQKPIGFLAVEVIEGSVEVNNDKGSGILKASQRLIVEHGQEPYDYYQDEHLPVRLRERIKAAVEAMETGDPKAYIANYNTEYMYKLIKGQQEYNPNLFGGSQADLERLRQGLKDIESKEDMINRFLSMGISKAKDKLYIRSVELNKTGDHAQASCLERKATNQTTITSPQWHYFDNDWWQIDD